MGKLQNEVTGYQGSRRPSKNTPLRWRTDAGEGERKLKKEPGPPLRGPARAQKVSFDDASVLHLRTDDVPVVAFYLTPHQRGSLWD